MKWWRRLGVKIPAITLILAIGPLLFFGISAVRQGENVLMENIRQSNRIALNHAILRTETLIQHILGSMSLAADTLEMGTLNELDRQYALQLIQKKIPELRTLALLDEDGKETARIDLEKIYPAEELADRARDPAFIQAMGSRPFVGRVKTSDNGERMLTLAVPLISARERSVFGVLTAEASIRNLLEEIPSTGVGGCGFIYVVDPNGNIIAHPDQSRVLAGDSLAENSHFQHFLQDDKAHLEELHRHMNAMGNDVLSMGIQSAGLGWVFMVEHPAVEALALVNALIRNLKILSAIILPLVILGAFYLIFGFSRPLGKLYSAAESMASGRLDTRVDIRSGNEIGRVAGQFNAMAENLQETSREQRRLDWIKTGQVELDNRIRGKKIIDELARGIITFFADYLGARVGAFYLRDRDNTLRFKGGYACKGRPGGADGFRMGEGLIGQAAADGKAIRMDNVEGEIIRIVSGVGDAPPTSLIVFPCIVEDTVAGIIELGFLEPLSDAKKSFLEDISERVAIAVLSIQDRERVQEALAFSRNQTEKLAAQQEELRAANEELQEQALALRARNIDP